MPDPLVREHVASISPLLELAIEAADAAGKVIRAGAGQINQITSKGIGDLVSQVDIDADHAATAVLQAGSDLTILSEEVNSSQAEADNMWIVDPLDGTNAFLMQAGPQYPSVLVSLRQNHETTLGVVYFPLTDEWFYAMRGRGAWLNGKRLVCDAEESLSDVWVEMNQYGDASLETLAFAELRCRLRSADGARLVTSQLPNSGVAMRIAQSRNPLAAAVHDNNPASVKQAPWDIAAPQIVLEEAGGVFVNLDGERSNPFRAEPIIVARSAVLAKQIIDLVVRQPADS